MKRKAKNTITAVQKERLNGILFFFNHTGPSLKYCLGSNTNSNLCISKPPLFVVGVFACQRSIFWHLTNPATVLGLFFTLVFYSH